VKEIVKTAIYFNGLGDLLGAHQYPYEEYGERREGRLAVKMQNPGWNRGSGSLIGSGLLVLEPVAS
jgi:hypothetical protein